jgi:hypothetical protein
MPRGGYDQGPPSGDNDAGANPNPNNGGGFVGVDPPEAEAPAGLNGGVNVTFFATLSKPPEKRNARKTNNPYVTATVIPMGLPRDTPQFWTLNAYDDAMQTRVLGLSVKDTLEIRARLQSISLWVRDSGETTPTVSIVPTGIETVDFIVRKRAAPSSTGPAAGERPVPPLDDSEIPFR